MPILVPPLGPILAALLALVALAGLCGTPATAQELVAVPPLAARVTDLTGTLSAADRERIESRLAALEQRKGAQVAVLIVPTTAPEDIAAYSIRVVEAWRLGRAKAGDVAVDDGVLLLVALNDRRMRIEVGRGLEGAIPDALARRVIAEIIAPRFRDGAYGDGIAQGVDRIAGLIEGEALPAPWHEPRHGAADRAADDAPDPVFPLIAGLMIGLAAAARLGRLPGGVAGGLTAGAAAVITGLPIWLAGVSALVILAAVPLLLALGAGGGGPVGHGLPRGGHGWGGHGPASGAGNGAGRGRGGAFGSGGFRGGGGSFGGGGASGDW